MSEHTIETPVDLDVNQQKDIHLDSANDLATTSGVAQIQQSVGLDVLSVTDDFLGGPLTGETVGKLEENIRDSLATDEQVLDVTNVSITEFNQDLNTVEADIRVVDDPDFSIEVML